METIRIGIIGCGSIGRTHSEAVRRLQPAATLVAVTGGSRAPALAKEFRADHEPSLESLLKRPDIDAVVIGTPHHLHASQSLAALQHGKHVLVEKPLATSLEDCDRLTEEAEGRKLTLAVCYPQRFRVNNHRACELIRSGAIGKMLTFQVSMPMYQAEIKSGRFGGTWDWWEKPESIGHLINSSPHAVDLIRLFTGAEVTTVSAFCRTFLPQVPIEDTTLALLEFSNGTLGTLFSSRALPAPIFPGEEFRFRIMGTTGLIDLDSYGELRLSEPQGWRVVSVQPTVGQHSTDTVLGDVRMQAFRDQIRSFMDAIQGQPLNAPGKSTVGSPKDGRAGVEVCLAMLQSSREKRWVSL